MSVSLKPYSKALLALEEAIQAEKTDLNRDASILRFKFSVELAWKTAKKLMDSRETLPKQIIRDMAQARLIEDTQPWFDALKYRNLSSHTYNEDLAEEVYLFIQSFFSEAKKLESKLSHL